MHADIGRHARASRIDRLLTLGELSAQAAGAFGEGARHYSRIEDLITALEAELAPDVMVLVKGSRFMRMERVVQAIEEKSEASGARK